LDCACDYGNEVEVGQGVKRAIDEGVCTRAELWITSKLWNTYHAQEHVKAACQKSLSDMGVDYFDLYLIHFPISQKFVPFETRYPPEWIHDPTAENPKIELAPVPYAQTWAGMESLVDEGLVKNIGVANLVVGLFVTHLLYHSRATLTRDLFSWCAGPELDGHHELLPHRPRGQPGGDAPLLGAGRAAGVLCHRGHSRDSLLPPGLLQLRGIRHGRRQGHGGPQGAGGPGHGRCPGKVPGTGDPPVAHPTWSVDHPQELKGGAHRGEL
jgi:hypothetical protein